MRARKHAVFAAALCTIVVAAAGATPATPRAAAQDEAVNQARRLDLAGQHDAAIGLYQQALNRAPDSFDAHYGLARALDLAGRYDEARQHFARAIALASGDEKDQALRMMGVSYAFIGDARGAATYFRQVFDRRLAAGNVDGAAEVANELGRVYLELGDPDNGYNWYRTSYETALRPANQPPSAVDLARLRWAHAQARVAARKGNAREARRQEAVVQSLLDKGTNPDQAIQLPYLHGYVDFYLKDYAGAIANLQKADQSDPFILVLLAEASEKVGKAAAARTYYRQALTSSSHAVNNAFARPIARQHVAATAARTP